MAQLCPCSGPQRSNAAWRNHGKYVSCVAGASNQFVTAGLVTQADKDATVSAAGQSSCGQYGSADLDMGRPAQAEPAASR